MANFDGSGKSGTQLKKASGTGTNADPFIEEIKLSAGDENVGNVDVLTIAAGDNNIGNVDVLSIAAGNNNIGDVDVASIAAGNNNIGDVDVKLIDENGTAYGVKHIDNKPRVSAVPYYDDIAEGNVPDHTSVNKFGHNTAVGANLEPVWDYSGAYEYLADDTFSLMYISSDNAADQGMTYSVTGIDSDYNYSTVTVTTDGASGFTFVALTSGATDDKWWRVFRAFNTSATVAQGNIYISKDNTDVGGNGIPDTVADIQAQILIGLEQTAMALWTCPTGHKAFLTSFYAATSSNKVTEVVLFYRPFGTVFRIQHFMSLNQGFEQHHFDFPVHIPAKADIVIQASATGGGGEVSGGFDLWFETT